MNDMFIATRQDFIELADAIRTKAKVTDGLAFPSGMIEAIDGIGGSSGSGCVGLQLDAYADGYCIPKVYAVSNFELSEIVFNSYAAQSE